MRVAKIKTKAQASAATGHNYRQHQVPNADQAAPYANREYVNTAGLDYWTLAEQRIQEASVKRVRSDSVRAMEVIMTGSPEAFIRGADGRAADYSNSQWAADNLNFLKERFGAKNVLSFTLHQDETTPHVHAMVTPITEDGRLSADQLFNPQSLRQLQTDYAQTASQVAQLATPSVPAGIALGEPPRLVGRDEWRQQEEARINGEVARQVAEANTRLKKVASVALVNTSAKEQAEVLRKQLHTSEQTKQELFTELKQTRERLEAAAQRHDQAAVQVAQGDVPAVQELARYGASVRERSRQDLEQTIVQVLKGPVKDGQDFIEKVRAQGFEFTQGAEGRSTFSDPLTTATFTVAEVKPGGQALRPQVAAAIERTTEQAQRQERDRSQSRGVGR